ncbi:hypothetical protein [Asticcacaulis benevestitus]|uniref:Uncharacterized protein n=1 Tax=Asticcacaulis benevestitus DSM 16100 = ATCC BAA-896 TaxID=1121022 RepID=V4R0P4_9CAUL|nr:hypothetical protein [Asticcacaulis benevestitus]ESQ84973.1 hypothetical protein ABENE_19335 [Asticcacaulis benevestitus DSM 16100 = ATCC BAA-896]
MTESNQRTAYIFYIVFTSILVACLAFVWFMSPLGLGFARWPERELLQSIYAGSYYAGIPAILIAKVISPVLFAYRKRKAAYGVPAISIAVFLICVTLILSNVN